MLHGALNILYTDDDQEDQLMFIDAVNEVSDKIRVFTQATGDELIRSLNNPPPSPFVIFLDLNMPKMNGKQCLKLLKEDASFKNIPVIIYTTSYQEKDREETMGLGAHYFLTKPTSINQLKKEVGHILTLQPQ